MTRQLDMNINGLSKSTNISEYSALIGESHYATKHFKNVTTAPFTCADLHPVCKLYIYV